MVTVYRHMLIVTWQKLSAYIIYMWKIIKGGLRDFLSGQDGF